MSDTQEKLCPECGLPITICNIVYFASIGFSEVKTVQQEYQRDARKEVQELIDSAKREGAIEIRNLYGSPKCEALHHPKKYQHTALEDCPVEEEINALTEQSEESK